MISKENSNTHYTCINCKLCPNLHNIGYIYSVNSIYRGSKDRYYSGISCDNCSSNISFNESGKPILKCLDCEWDICRNCEDKLFYQTKFQSN